jgi:hypothetical protein
MNKFEFIFYHIPKCGGSSIREFLKQLFLSKQFNNEDIYVACEEQGKPNIMDDTKLGVLINNYNTTKILLAHINNNLFDRLHSHFTITCVRNPIHRAISSFNHFVLTDTPTANFEQLFIESKLKTVVKNCYDCPIWLRKNVQDYTFIMVFENLDNDLSTLSHMLHVDNQPQIPHIDPAKKNKAFNPNIFKLDLEKPLHKQILNAMKTILAPDIDIYNHICLMRKLNHLVI